MGKKKTTDEFKLEVKALVGNEYKVIGEYHDNKTKILIKHEKCQETYPVRPNNFLSGDRCPYCSKENRRKNNEQFVKEVYALVGDEYIFIESYFNNKTLIKVKHNKCNHTYEVTPTHFLSGRRCPRCNGRSYFEKEIAKVLDEYNINYEIETIFEEFKSDKYAYYRFDFCIYLDGGEILLIEYDGEQHDKPKYGMKEWLRTQESDRVKDEFCRKNNYKLLRIKYFEDEKYYKDVLIQHIKTHIMN